MAMAEDVDCSTCFEHQCNAAWQMSGEEHEIVAVSDVAVDFLSHRMVGRSQLAIRACLGDRNPRHRKSGHLKQKSCQQKS